MALLPIQKFFVFNNELKPINEFVPSENEGGIYEVLRVVKGVPLFFEEHLERFYSSAQIAGKEILFSSKQIRNLIKDLIAKNNLAEGNILISCKTNFKAFFIAHRYPGQHQYNEGVKCCILKAERKNPNAKVFQTSIRLQANKIIDEKGFYEVLLVDHLGRITEGSRSNIFFVKGEKLVTPPAFEVLLGITRQKTIFLAKELRLQIAENDILFDELDTYDAAFITGTSPKILPVQTIGAVSFNTQNEILKRLIIDYDKLIDSYINKFSE